MCEQDPLLSHPSYYGTCASHGIQRMPGPLERETIA